MDVINSAKNIDDDDDNDDNNDNNNNDNDNNKNYNNDNNDNDNDNNNDYDYDYDNDNGNDNNDNDDNNNNTNNNYNNYNYNYTYDYNNNNNHCDKYRLFRVELLHRSVICLVQLACGYLRSFNSISGTKDNCDSWPLDSSVGLILGLRPANERRRYFVTTSLIGWAGT